VPEEAQADQSSESGEHVLLDDRDLDVPRDGVPDVDPPGLREARLDDAARRRQLQLRAVLPP